jgi:hypothetical protein
LLLSSVAINGDTVGVASGVFAPGATYVFFKPGTGWATTSTFDAKLTSSDGTLGDAFGVSAVSGDTVVVGAEFATIGSNFLQGAAYVFGFFVPFSAFSAKVDTQQGPPPSFDVKASFTLGAASRGINLASESVTLQVGAFSATTPAGSFKLQKKGVFQFEGTINGVTLDVKIEPLGSPDQSRGSGRRPDRINQPGHRRAHDRKRWWHNDSNGRIPNDREEDRSSVETSER